MRTSEKEFVGLFRTRLELWPMLGLVPIRLAQEGITQSFSTQAKNSLDGLGINIKRALKESPIHRQNFIELKTKGAIVIGNVGERKEDDGKAVF